MPEGERYRDRLTAGLCTVCGNNPAEHERTKCLACLEQAAWRGAEERERRYKAGLCPICGKHRPNKGFRSCEPCRARARLAYGKRGHQLAQGIRTRRM
jgi:hypothetical protein